jgi:HEAT repeat protein
MEAVVKPLVNRAWEAEDGEAMRALGRLRSTMATDFFAAKLRDRSPDARQRAALVLGQLHTDRALEYLLPQLRDNSAEVRDQVIASLGASRSERVIEPLLVALRGDPRVGTVDTRTRVAAARALGNVGTDKAVPALIVDLQVGEPAVREEAARALEQIRSEFAVKPLESVKQTAPSADARHAAAEVLAAMGAGRP